MFIRAEADGLTDAQPLVLRGVEKKDFIPLLQCLYPMYVHLASVSSLTPCLILYVETIPCRFQLLVHA